MNLYLLRHGNTFDEKFPPVWAGSKEDFPLVARGLEQANEAASYFKSRDLSFSKIFASPLKRTQKTAEIIKDVLEQDIEISTSSYLNEIDYGKWGGKTNLEVKELGFEVEQDNWNEKSSWPPNADWFPSENKCMEEVMQFNRDLISSPSNMNKNILIVSSNGRLRYFLKLIDNEFEKRIVGKDFKMKTGALSLVSFEASKWNLGFWNKSPAKL